MYSQRVRIFEPKSPRPYLIGPPIQRGEGWGSFFSGLARIGKKVLPYATRGIKKLVKSDVVKEVGNTLLQNGVNAATDIAANLLEGKENPFDDAKDRLQETRKDIADTIRKRKIIDVSTDIPSPKKKRKKQNVKKVALKNKKKKRYNIFEDFEDV